MPIAPELLTSCWNELYLGGRYLTEPPLPFTSQILATLRQDPRALAGRGLYVGCGNGRNFVPLTRAGLRLHGLDISQAAIDTLAARVPEAAGRLRCGDFQTYEAGEPFDYLVAIQVLQHGSQADVEASFARVADVVRPGGYFFVRVNATDCDLFFDSRPLDANEHGGYSVQCLSGPKTGQPIHFFARQELLELTRGAFRLLSGPDEMREVRPPPRTGGWSQWEAVFQRV